MGSTRVELNIGAGVLVNQTIVQPISSVWPCTMEDGIDYYCDRQSPFVCYRGNDVLYIDLYYTT